MGVESEFYQFILKDIHHLESLEGNEVHGWNCECSESCLTFTCCGHEVSASSNPYFRECEVCNSLVLPDIYSKEEKARIKDKMVELGFLSEEGIFYEAGGIDVGDYYRDCRYHPVKCTEVEEGGDLIGVSLITNLECSCNYYHCGVERLCENDVKEIMNMYSKFGERGLMLHAGWKEWQIDKFLSEWR